LFGRDANKFSTQKFTMVRNTSQRVGAGYSEYGNEADGSTRSVEFLEHLRDC